MIHSIRMFFFQDIMECVSTPCLNGGTCDERRGSFMCDCVAGYTGGLCETGMQFFSKSNIDFAVSCMSSPAETKQNACLGGKMLMWCWQHVRNLVTKQTENVGYYKNIRIN